MKRAGVLVLLAALALLTGCSAGATYESTTQLHEAYVEAGSNCADPTEVPGSMLSEGAHGVFCADDGKMAMLIVFDTTEDADRYIARVDSPDYEGQMIAGERWVVAGDQVATLGDAMNGRVVRD